MEKNIIDKAVETISETSKQAEKVASKVGDVLEKIPEKMDEILDATIQKGADVADKLIQKTEKEVKLTSTKKVFELKDYGTQRAAKAIQQFEKSLPVLERAGYELSTFDLDIGVVPQVVARFQIIKHIDAETREKLLSELKNDRATQVILSALFKANAIQKNIKFGNMKLNEVEVHIGTMPKVKARFRKRQDLK